MTAQASRRGDIVTSRDQLVAYMEAGCKPAERQKIGVEDEKFVYCNTTHLPVGYHGPNGTGAILRGLIGRYGWNPVWDGDVIIAVLNGAGASISPEAGRHLEISGAPHRDVHQVHQDLKSHLGQIEGICEGLGLQLLGLGFQPKCRRDDVPMTWSGRSKIIGEYLPKRGRLGLDMLLRTAALQVNLDFSSESDMRDKFRVALSLQPVISPLFAASPFVEGQVVPFQSYRGHVWTGTDSDRTGMLPFVFEDGFGFERYVDYALDVPMIFVYRDGRYIDATGQSFRDFLIGRLPALPGELPGLGDWANHLATIFADVRLKHVLEMRGADGGPPERLCALAAVWTGLLYDRLSLDAALDLVGDWSIADRLALHGDVPARGLRAKVKGRSLRELTLQVLEIAEGGLRRRARKTSDGMDETLYLEPLVATATAGYSPADLLIDLFYESWDGDIDRIFRPAPCAAAVEI